jgi:transposase
LFGFWETKSMPKPYSDDLRERVIEAVVAGASRREAAESFSLSASSAVRWLQRWRDTGSARAKLSGGSTSPLEEHVEWLLALVAKQPDMTLDEIVAAMRKQRIPGSRTAVWRFSSDIISPSGEETPKRGAPPGASPPQPLRAPPRLAIRGEGPEHLCQVKF